MKTRFKKLLYSTNVEGMDKLIAHLEIDGFFDAPASSKYHLAEPNGLLKHSLNVYDAMEVSTREFCSPHYTTKAPFTHDDVIIVSLLHDVGKMGFRGKAAYVDKVLKSGKSAADPYEINKELIKIPHQDLSLLICSQYIELTEQQMVAIKFHNGLYSPDGRDISGKETPLMIALHFADMWASRVMEG